VADLVRIGLITRGLRSLSVVVVLAAWPSGCASEGQSASRARLEESIKRQVAEALFEEYQNFTEAEVKRVASSLRVSCHPAAAPDYTCAIDYGEEEVHCTVRPNAAFTRTTSMRCSGAKAPVTEEGFVDCAKIGSVVTAVDAEGDVTENARPLPRKRAASAELQKADLRGVGVAATPERLCVQWETAAPIAPEYGLNFWAYPSGGGARESVSLSVEFEPGLAPDVGVGPYGSVSGRVGANGRFTSVVVEAGDLPERLRPALAGPFTFSAHSAWVVGRTDPDQAFGDELDPQHTGGRPSYP
jgi:hypothetical protein